MEHVTQAEADRYVNGSFRVLAVAESTLDGKVVKIEIMHTGEAHTMTVTLAECKLIDAHIGHEAQPEPYVIDLTAHTIHRLGFGMMLLAKNRDNKKVVVLFPSGIETFAA